MTDATNDTRLQLGRVDGRLSALESRIDRHENFVTQKLASIEDKLDRALLHRAGNAGALRAVHWIGSGIITLIAWIIGHFTSSTSGSH